MDAARPQVRNSREGEMGKGSIAVTIPCFPYYHLLLLLAGYPSYHIAIPMYPWLLASLPSNTTNTHGTA